VGRVSHVCEGQEQPSKVRDDSEFPPFSSKCSKEIWAKPEVGLFSFVDPSSQGEPEITISLGEIFQSSPLLINLEH
jgi:hypothetical protein